MPTTMLRFLASDPAIRTAIGERAADLIRLRAGTGWGLYGPYVNLPRGRCIARITFEGASEGRATMEMSAEAGEIVLASCVVDLGALGGHTVELSAELPRPLSGCEVRLYCGSEVRADIAAVELEISSLEHAPARMQSYTQTATKKAILQDNVAHFVERRPELYAYVTSSEQFKAAGAFLYGGEITQNLGFILELFDRTGCYDFLAENGIRSVADVGGANGDLSFVFSMSGFQTTLVDLTLPWGLNGPLVASLINARLNSNVRVIDYDVDRYFEYFDLIKHTVNFGQFEHRDARPIFDLVVCVGLFYHLKNPLAFLESLAKICRFCVLGTFCMSYLPDNVTRVRDTPIAYLLDRECGNDPTNYWIMTHASYERMVRMAGFEIQENITDILREDKVSNAIDENYNEREFLLMRSTITS